MSYDKDKLGKMTFEVVIQKRGSNLPDSMIPLLNACIKGEAVVLQVDGKDCFTAIPTGLDTEHHSQHITHRATFTVERAPAKRVVHEVTPRPREDIL